MKPVGVWLAVAVVASASPSAAAIDVRTFLAKSAELKAKGSMAMLSSDTSMLKQESTAAAKALKADKMRRKAAGQPLLYCTPDGAKMTADELLAGMEAIPVADRGISLQAGMVRMLATKYPCR